MSTQTRRKLEITLLGAALPVLEDWSNGKLDSHTAVHALLFAVATGAYSFLTKNQTPPAST